MGNITVREMLKKYDEEHIEEQLKHLSALGETNLAVKLCIDVGWYDWFCKDSALAAKTISLVKKVRQLSTSKLINQDTMYVFFKNNCPVAGSLYDSFSFCDMRSGDVLYWITPRNGHKVAEGKAQVYDQVHGFEVPIVDGGWKDAKAFFA